MKTLAKKVLTVAVPMYQVQQYIKKCLESFLIKEIEQKIEILAVDDGSSDRTAAIAKQYASKYPHLIRYIRKKNGGHGSAVNTALGCANSRYFMVVDADDWVRQEDFQELVMQLEKLDVDLAVSHYVRVKGAQETMVDTKSAAIWDGCAVCKICGQQAVVLHCHRSAIGRRC